MAGAPGPSVGVRKGSLAETVEHRLTAQEAATMGLTINQARAVYDRIG